MVDTGQVGSGQLSTLFVIGPTEHTEGLLNNTRIVLLWGRLLATKRDQERVDRLVPNRLLFF
jgi:hypothetical protein